jgi:acyl-CoA dehydrogenase
MALADMKTELEAARLLVRQAALEKDQGARRVTLAGSMAKLYATEMAQRVVDRALQIHGGQGLLRGRTVERLYREVRALRIYEGTSEVQKLIIARQLLRHSKDEA